MKLERNTYYVMSASGIERFCLATLKDSTLYLEFPYQDLSPQHYRVEVESEDKDHTVFDCYAGDNYVGDLTLRRLTRKEPLLASIGIDGSKCESDDEVDAYVYIYFNKTRKATIMKVKQ